MFNLFSSLNSHSFPKENQDAYERGLQSINTGKWIEHFYIKSNIDFSLLVLQQLNGDQLQSALYQIKQHFNLDKLIYEKNCKYNGIKQYSKLSKNLEHFFLIIKEGLILIHFNILNNLEQEIIAKQDYRIEVLKISEDQSLILLCQQSQKKKSIEIEIRSILQSDVIFQQFNLCSNSNLEYLNLQRIDISNRTGIIVEQDCMDEYQIFIKHIVNQKIANNYIINTRSNHLVDIKTKSIFGLDCNFLYNEYSQSFKLYITSHRKILRQLCIKRIEFCKIVDNNLIVIGEQQLLNRVSIFQYDIKTGNKIYFQQNQDFILKIQKLKVEMNQLFLCSYRWISKIEPQERKWLG